MARRIFLDVGAHRGETAKAALMFDFDEVHSFEPASAQRAVVEELAASDPRLSVHAFGLAGRDGSARLYFGAYTTGASLFADKRNVDPDRYEDIHLRRASHWMQENVSPDDMILMKINVEGAEVEILEDLESSGQLPWFRQLLYYPDSRKVASLRSRGRVVTARITAAHQNVRSAHDVFNIAGDLDITTRTANWLQTLDEVARIPATSGQVGSATPTREET